MVALVCTCRFLGRIGHATTLDPSLPVPNNIMLLPLPPGSGTGGHAQRDSVLHPKAAFSRSTLCAHMTCLNALKLSWLLCSQWSFFVRARIDSAIRSGSLQKISASTPSYNRTRTLRKAGARSRLSGDRYLKSRESETCGILLVNCNISESRPFSLTAFAIAEFKQNTRSAFLISHWVDSSLILLSRKSHK